MTTSTGETGALGPTALVRAAVEALDQQFFEPLTVAALYQDAWDGATACCTHAGVSPVPPLTYPAEPDAAAAVHASAFPALERLAAGRLGPDDLLTATLRELLARRRDGHTFLSTSRMQQPPPAGPRGDLGLVLADTPPLRVADALPGGPAQRAGLRRGQEVLAINGHPCADLRRSEAMALLDRRAGAPNRLTVRDQDGRTRVVEARGAPAPRISTTLLPGPVGLLRIDGFAATDEETAELRAALESFERAGARGWIVDLRWCGGGFSIPLSRLLVDRGRLFSRASGNQVHLPGGRVLAARQDIDADGTALPFQRPFAVLIGPGSISGAESFAGPMRALGRATLVGERTAGLCGSARARDLAPGWRITLATHETVFGPEEWRLNRIGVPPDVAVTPSPDDEAVRAGPAAAALSSSGAREAPA